MGDRPATVPALTRTIYTDIPAALFPAAERNVFAHLIDLSGRGCVQANAKLSPNAEFLRI